MFYSTTHYKNWIFSSKEELCIRRQEANQRFISNNIDSFGIQNHEKIYDCFLTMDEETALITNYLGTLKDFCRKFTPPMPKYVINTAIQYFKRFYLNNSVMEHHPKHIMVTCTFLAAKIEEFNVSMQEFITNVRGDRGKARKIVLENELLLLHRLNYQLTIWHPYRPIEGFLIDIKTRYPECRDPDRYRKHIDVFLDQSFSTDVCFLLCPNQLALLAILYAAEQCHESLDDYLRILFANKLEEIDFLKKWQIKLAEIMPNVEIPSRDYFKQIEKKLEQCQERIKPQREGRLRQSDEEEEEAVTYERYSQYRNEQEQMEQQLMDTSR